MKKFFIILILSFIPFFLNAQIYTSIRYLDKFDDEIKIENVKTIVEKTDSTFIVETKGKVPVEYRIVCNNILNSAGSDNETVNLFNNVYGFQESWYVMTKDDFNKWKDVGTLPAGQFLLTIAHRVIKTQYTHEYKSEYFWIEDETNIKFGKNINRIIYIK